MNYFALAGAIIAGLIALSSAARILRVSVTDATWDGAYGFQLNVLIVAITAPLTAWFAGMVIG